MGFSSVPLTCSCSPYRSSTAAVLIAMTGVNSSFGISRRWFMKVSPSIRSIMMSSRMTSGLKPSRSCSSAWRPEVTAFTRKPSFSAITSTSSSTEGSSSTTIRVGDMSVGFVSLPRISYPARFQRRRPFPRSIPAVRLPEQAEAVHRPFRRTVRSAASAGCRNPRPHPRSTQPRPRTAAAR